MKTIIIGLGSMGHAHLKALINVDLIKEIHIYDIHKNKLINLKKKYKKKIKILNSLKENNNYQLAVIATNSLDRLKVLKKLINFNKVKNILLEKFPFTKLSDLKLFENKIYFKSKNNIDVNTWGKYIANRLKLKYKPTNIIVKTNSKNFLSNFIHFADIFLFYNNKEKYFINLSKLKKKIYKNTRKGYHEKRGKILINSKSLSFEYIYNHKLKNLFEISFINKNKIFLRIEKDNNTKLKIIDNNVRLIEFPIAKILTKKYFNDTLKFRRSKDFSTLQIIKFSKLLLKEINKIKIKNFYIT